jgi:hypothetical protein
MQMLKRLATALLLALVAASAAATSLARMSLGDLARTARTIVRVRCLGSESRWEKGEIWTFTRFEPLETLKGSAPQPLVVRLIGGRVGNLASVVDGVPRFRPGEEVILFLERTRAGDLSVTAWSEGSFRVRRDPRTARAFVTQDSAATGVFNPATRRFEPAGIEQMPLEFFEQRLRRILQGGQGAQRP